MPQSSGRFGALVILKTSVAHVDAKDAVFAAAVLKTVLVSVDGPVRTKVLKSNRICNQIKINLQSKA